MRDLETELKPKIDKILNHRFIKRLIDASLTLEELRYFAIQYKIYCEHFPRFLSATASNIPDDETRMSLIENLWDEHGNGDIQKSHRKLYYNFCKGLGLSDLQIKTGKASPPTAIYVEFLLKICQENNYLKSLGALGPGTEFFTSQEYELIYSALNRYDFLDEKSLEFWFVHISLDDDHYNEMLQSILNCIKTEADFQTMKEGAELAVDLELLFWEGLEDQLFGS